MKSKLLNILFRIMVTLNYQEALINQLLIPRNVHHLEPGKKHKKNKTEKQRFLEFQARNNSNESSLFI